MSFYDAYIRPSVQNFQNSALFRGFGSSKPPQTGGRILKHNQSLGNANSRVNPLPGAPAYGNTTNPNGAQTASSMVNFHGQTSPTSFPAPPQVMGQRALKDMAQAPAGFPAPPQVIGQRAQQDMAQAPQPQYPGGDVAGLSSYYRNKAMEQYRQVNPEQPLIQPSAPNSSLHASQLIGSTTQSNLSPDQKAQAYGAINGYDGLTAGYNDPNRLTPQQKEAIAQQDAVRQGQYDPTNLSGRFGAGTPLGSQAATIAAGQAGVANGSMYALPQGFGKMPEYRPINRQAEETRMAGIASDSAARALNPQASNAAYSYTNADGELVSTNRLGMLQQMQKDNPNDPAIQSAIHAEQQRTGAMRDRQNARQDAVRDANGGMTANQRDRMVRKRDSLARAVRQGFISQSEASAKLRTHEDTLANKLTARKALQDKGYSNQTAYSAPPSGLRLPDGQLPQEERAKAAETAQKLTDPNYSDPDPSFNLQAQSIQAMGLTGDMSSDQAASQIAKTPIPADDYSRQIYIDSLRAYWSSRMNTDATWNKKSDQASRLLEGLAKTKNQEEARKWLTEKWMPHLGYTDKDGNTPQHSFDGVGSMGGFNMPTM